MIEVEKPEIADGAAVPSPVQSVAAEPAPDQPPPPAQSAQPAAGRGTSSPPGAAPQVEIEIELVCGDITRVAAPVAVCGHYDGVPLVGAARAFDKLLGRWISRCIEFQMIGARLGQFCPINLNQFKPETPIQIEELIVVGLGEPSRLAADDIRFLISNVTIAVKGMGYACFASSLLGTRRREMPVKEASRALLEGVLDGYERLRAIGESETYAQERFRRVGGEPLRILIVEPDAAKLDLIEKCLQKAPRAQGLLLSVKRRPDLDIPVAAEDREQTEREESITAVRLRATQKLPAGGSGGAAGAQRPGGAQETLQFSAMSDTSVVAEREVELSAYLLENLPMRLCASVALEMRERFGRFFASAVIPDDFRDLVGGAPNLVLEVDSTTAKYPWEMIAQKRYSRTVFMGADICVARQFRTKYAPPPTSPPALSRMLRVLVIADPAAGSLKLEGAREEGFAVARVLQRAAQAWEGVYDIKATLRIGSCRDKDPNLIAALAEWEDRTEVIVSADRCDPLEVNMQIATEAFDVIHYAGHGFFDEKTKQAGWVLDQDCYLTSSDLFRVRQVPRLVFANACYSAEISDETGERSDPGRHVFIGAAQAFFERGIPNYIGAGWPVQDGPAQDCARWFYASALGLRSPNGASMPSRDAQPNSIAQSLLTARKAIIASHPQSPAWGAYQHYGHIEDTLLPPLLDSFFADSERLAKAAFTAAQPQETTVEMTTQTSPAATQPSASADLVYFNGVDADTGEYATKARSLDELARIARANPRVAPLQETHGEQPRSFGLPPSVNFEKLDEAGWGVIFHESAAKELRDALAPLLDWRRKGAAQRFKTLDYKSGEQTRDWYRRNAITPGSLDPEIMPYYLLIVGPPDAIPFEFQYLLGVDYAVGRLCFDAVGGYAAYAHSLVAQEESDAPSNTRKIVYWGTRHSGDPPTDMSARLLVAPLANGDPALLGQLKKPLNDEYKFKKELFLGEDASKKALLDTINAAAAPAMLFTASHGMSVANGRPDQKTVQGALLCQDWPGFGMMNPDCYFSAADVDDGANVRGLVAFHFACYGAGTPDIDQYLLQPEQLGAPPKRLAPQPFMAALPQRLLSHPKGSALAVIAHVDRAWSYSITAPKMSGAQIATFRNCLGYLMKGAPVGHAVKDQFGGRFAALSTELLSAISPTSPTARMDDRTLVTCWLERNDAQNYVTLGDPAARLREDKLA